MSFAPFSFKVAATLTAYRIVRLTSAELVNYCTATSDFPIGITTDDVKETTQAIPVQTHGIARLYMNDSCASGGLVASNALGQGIPAVATSAGIYIIGINVGPAVQVTGTLSRILIRPMQIQSQA